MRFLQGNSIAVCFGIVLACVIVSGCMLPQFPQSSSPTVSTGTPTPYVTAPYVETPTP